MIKIWKIAQIPPGNHWNQKGINAAMRTKINSPANKLPNKRSASESGFAISSTNLKKTFTGIRYQPKGLDNTSIIKFFAPLALKL